MILRGGKVITVDSEGRVRKPSSLAATSSPPSDPAAADSSKEPMVTRMEFKGLRAKDSPANARPESLQHIRQLYPPWGEVSRHEDIGRHCD